MTNKKELTSIECKYNLPNDEKLYFGKIEYRNGILINFTTQNANVNFNKNDNFICNSLDNDILLLWNNQFCDKNFGIVAGFDSLIKGFKNVEQIKELKFKKINFSFPCINEFFLGIDKIERYNPKNPNDVYLRYIKTKTPLIVKLNDKFKLKLINDVSWGGGTFGGENLKISLIKEIQVVANKMTSLDEFNSVIRKLINFFSFGLKHKVPIINMYSCGKNNTSKCKLEITPFQYKIENQDFDSVKKYHKYLYIYPNIKKHFSKILSTYMDLQNKDYRKFAVIIDLYLRNHDVPDEIYPQIKFLVYTQALEAYLNSKKCNDKKPVSIEYIALLEKLKIEYPYIKEIQELKKNGLYSFKEKLANCIKQNNIQDIIKLQYAKNGKIKLLEDLVNMRNYYTHYSCSSNDKRLKNIDDYALIESAKALLELFILKDLKLDDNSIKIILSNNYFRLKDFNSKYIWISNPPPKVKDVDKNNYLGEEHPFYNENKQLIFSMYYFYEESSGKIKLIIKYSKEGIYTRKNSNRLKSLTKELLIDKNIKENEVKKLPKYFQECYRRYVELIKQKNYQVYN